MSRYFDVAPPPLPSLAAVASTIPLSGLAPGERRLRVTFNATRQAGGDEMLHASRDVSWTRTAAHPRSGRRRCWCGQRPAALSGVANNGIRRQPRRVKRARGYGGALATNRRRYGHWQAPGTGTSIACTEYIRTDVCTFCTLRASPCSSNYVDSPTETSSLSPQKENSLVSTTSAHWAHGAVICALRTTPACLPACLACLLPSARPSASRPARPRPPRPPEEEASTEQTWDEGFNRHVPVHAAQAALVALVKLFLPDGAGVPYTTRRPASPQRPAQWPREEHRLTPARQLADVGAWRARARASDREGRGLAHQEVAAKKNRQRRDRSSCQSHPSSRPSITEGGPNAGSRAAAAPVM